MNQHSQRDKDCMHVNESLFSWFDEFINATTWSMLDKQGFGIINIFDIYIDYNKECEGPLLWF